MKKVYYTPFNSTTGTLGTAKIDLSSATFADLVFGATQYDLTRTYIRGDLCYFENYVWSYVKPTSSAGNSPPTPPDFTSSEFWEVVGSNGLFTWIAYA